MLEKIVWTFDRQNHLRNAFKSIEIVLEKEQLSEEACSHLL